jgi:hypothetical protein
MLYTRSFITSIFFLLPISAWAEPAFHYQLEQRVACSTLTAAHNIVHHWQYYGMHQAEQAFTYLHTQKVCSIALVVVGSQQTTISRVRSNEQTTRQKKIAVISQTSNVYTIVIK